MRRLVALLCLAMTVVFFLPSMGGTALSQEALDPRPPSRLTAPLGTAMIPTVNNNPQMANVLEELLDVYQRDGISSAQSFAQDRLLKMVRGKVLVVIEVGEEPSATVAERVASVDSGIEIQSVAASLVSALVPPSVLGELSALPGVQRVRPPAWAKSHVGSEESQGVGAINADVWHASGYDGDGVRVAVVDFGFTDWSGLQSSGDLPSDPILQRHNYKSDAFENDGDHGSACAEIVYDVAPGVSELHLYAFDDDADLESIKDDMIADGIQAASMSIGWNNINGYDGLSYSGKPAVDDFVNDAASNGIFWAISMGNAGDRHYESYFLESSVPDYHLFDTGANINQIGYLTAGSAYICPFLEWSAWGSYGGQQRDYDLWVVYWDGSAWAGYYVFQDSAKGDPTEGGCLNILETTYYGIVIDRVNDGDWETRYLELYSWYQGFQYVVTESSLSPPADATGAVAVGAFEWDSPTTIESFSSWGPRNEDGGLEPDWSACGATPTDDCKADFAAPDGVDTVSYGPCSSPNGCFYGTSAAAPHAAAAAALVWDVYPSYTRGQVYDFLKNRAPDPGTLGTFKDEAWGWGRIWLGPAPTAVKLTTFTAEAAAQGVLLLWETASEHDNAGFNLYRSTTAEAMGMQLNEAIIPSKAPGGDGGAVYDFLDTVAAPGVAYFYTLEDVDLSGNRTAHGPVTFTLWRAYLPLVGR